MCSSLWPIASAGCVEEELGSPSGSIDTDEEEVLRARVHDIPAEMRVAVVVVCLDAPALLVTLC